MVEGVRFGNRLEQPDGDCEAEVSVDLTECSIYNLFLYCKSEFTQSPKMSFKEHIADCEADL